MQIYIYYERDVYTIEVEPNDTVDSVRYQLSIIAKIRPDQQKLLFKDTVVEDGYTLDTYNIQAGNTLKLQFRMRGD